MPDPAFGQQLLTMDSLTTYSGLTALVFGITNAIKVAFDYNPKPLGLGISIFVCLVASFYAQAAAPAVSPPATTKPLERKFTNMPFLRPRNMVKWIIQVAPRIRPSCAREECRRLLPDRSPCLSVARSDWSDSWIIVVLASCSSSVAGPLWLSIGCSQGGTSRGRSRCFALLSGAG